MQAKSSVNRHILELFLAQDLSEGALLNRDGEQIGYRGGYLQKEAAVFLSHLHSLGVRDTPKVDDLLREWQRF